MSENSPIPLSARLFAGSDKGLDFIVPEAEGLTATWTVAWYVWDDEAKGAKILEKNSSNDITVQDDATGTFRVLINSDDWGNVPPGQYYYEFWRTDGGAADALAYGVMMVR